MPTNGSGFYLNSNNAASIPTIFGNTMNKIEDSPTREESRSLPVVSEKIPEVFLPLFVRNFENLTIEIPIPFT